MNNMYKPYEPTREDIKLSQETFYKLQKDICNRYDNPKDVLSPYYYREKISDNNLKLCDKFLEEIDHNHDYLFNVIREIRLDRRFENETEYCIKYLLKTEERLIEQKRLYDILNI